MSLLDPALIETLLNMSESDVLDFKRDQYPLADDEQKSELVKDILAFANAWKTDDAHIVIGADENPGGRAVIVGIERHLNDADLQQLVNSKTNVAVSFEYVALTVDGSSLGVIRIKKAQQRPVYLQRAFGRLKQKVVYLRRGSSTAEADPTEIARMGTASAALETPQITLALADSEARRVFGTSVDLASKILEERPPPQTNYVPNILGVQNALAHQIRALTRPAIAMRPMWDQADPKKFVAYHKEVGLLSAVGLCVHNVGRLLVEDVRVLIKIPKHDELRVVDELPERPRSSILATMIPLTARLHPPVRSTVVDDCGGHWEVTARLGKIQPDATVWSVPCWLGSTVPRDLQLVARIFGDNISAPIEVPLQIRVHVEEGWIEEDDDDKSNDEDE